MDFNEIVGILKKFHTLRKLNTEMLLCQTKTLFLFNDIIAAGVIFIVIFISVSTAEGSLVLKVKIHQELCEHIHITTR